MKIDKLIILVSIILLFSNLQAQLDSTKKDNFRVIPNNAFSYGERLFFEVSYGFITGAEAFFYISPAPVLFNNREAYEINFEANTRPNFDMVYKVRDFYKTYIDVKGIFPWKYEQHIREADFKRDFIINFDQEKKELTTKTDNEEKKYTNMPEYVQDLFSALYYLRTMDLKKLKTNDVLKYQYFENGKVNSLDIIFREKEDVDVSAGEFHTLVFEPQLNEGFTSKTSDMKIWLTDDDRKIPVKVKMKIVIGAVVGELTQYSGLNGKLDSKIE
jgi:hypothetical protein